ncbi:MAG: NAD-dependent epimerase/dehydratase family protein, partial [Candidatus Norongarragalinales archaeon]
AELLLQKNFEVTVVDDLSSGSRANTPKNTRLVKASFFDEAVLHKELSGVESVFHLAGIVGVQYSLAHPEETRRVNVEGTAALLEACKAAGVRSFVFASSASVYGNKPKKEKQKESDELRPESPYAESKVEGEKLVAKASAFMNSCSLRLFNVYGPRQPICGEYSAVVPSFVNAALRGKPITVFGGSQTRDFIFVRDAARAFLLASRAAASGKAFNVASGKSISILELARKVKTLTRSNSQIKFAPERASEVRFSEADVSLARRELGFRARYSLNEGLAETIAYFKKL